MRAGGTRSPSSRPGGGALLALTAAAAAALLARVAYDPVVPALLLRLDPPGPAFSVGIRLDRVHRAVRAPRLPGWPPSSPATRAAISTASRAPAPCGPGSRRPPRRPW
ncbi:hypothetical protein V2I01_31785 [Micromonospora sp. BRA006-A]|nr:hypothetical protein [Micromonospora sp. BRA006-A]